MIGVGDPVPPTAAQVVGDEPTLLVFFKEACSTCQIGLPVFQHWSSQVNLIGVAQDDPDTTERFFADYGIAMDVVYDAPDFALSESFDIDGVPALFLAEDGVVTWARVGWSADDAGELAARLAAMSETEPILVGAAALPPYRPG